MAIIVARFPTSLISVVLGIACVIYCTGQTNAEQEFFGSAVDPSARLTARVRRQFDGNAFNNFGGGQQRGPNRRLQAQNQGRRNPLRFPNNDNNFGGQPQLQQLQQQQQPTDGQNNQLIFQRPQRQRPINGNSNNGFVFATTPAPAPGQNSNDGSQTGQPVFINNRPVLATMAPFTTRTTATPQFISCFNACPTTSEYNPICGSDQELYHNEQKFNCARRCGADIQIVRRGSCEGLFPMMRG